MEVSWINTRLGYGETVENQHTGKLQTRKNQKRAKME